MLGVVDLEFGDIDLDAGRDSVGAAAHFDGVSNDADRAATLDARRLLRIEHVDRDIDADRSALAQPHEVDMQRQVADGIELEIARDHAVVHAVDFHVVNGREKMACIDALAQIGVIQRDWQRRLAVAIDDSGYAAGTTFGPGGPLACPRTRRRLNQIDGRHDMILVLSPVSQREIPRQPPGVL
jgi:hypothetical protein